MRAWAAKAGEAHPVDQLHRLFEITAVLWVLLATTGIRIGEALAYCGLMSTSIEGGSGSGAPSGGSERPAWSAEE